MAIPIQIFDTPQDASRYVAELIASSIINRPTCTLGLATGSTPIPVYENLGIRHQSGELSFESVSTFNLDEYIGLPEDHPQSYRSFMNQQLFNHVNIDVTRTHLPTPYRIDKNFSAEDVASQYEAQIVDSARIDLQLLGIGTNGHIGFNEPGSSSDSVTRVVDLAASTIQANSRFFDQPDHVPRQAITMGISTILRARKIVLMATGASKADAIAGAINGPISTDNPSSFLQDHSDVVMVLDRDAASAIA